MWSIASLQSIGSEESVHDSRTDEKKLEPPATGDKEMPLYSNGNCADTTVDVASPPVKKPTSILRVSKANSKVTSPPPVPAIVSNGTETAINMEDLDEQPPHSSAKLEEKALQREASDEDLEDCGILASMTAGTSEEYFEETKDAPIAAAMVPVDDDMDCSTLAAMVVSNSVVEEEVNMSGLSHKGLISSRQLPPLGHSCEEMLGSHRNSLLSGSSQLLSQFGSANALPVPDPRHRPAATGGKKKKDKKPLRMPEHIREACPPPLPSPGY